MLITIGLEIHLKLNTSSKIFCRCRNDQSLDLKPNTNICPICTGQPGALPLLSQECVEKAIQFWKIFNAEIAEISSFDRKNYFYPDLPMGFQITQFFHPIIRNGKLKYRTDNFETQNTAQIHEAHLECDTAKMIHQEKMTLIDFNRAGTPLLEIVTEPTFSSAEQAVEFAKEIQRVARRNHLSDADMEKGQMRIDVNLSLRKNENDPLGTRTEMKNINTFNAMKRAIQHETERQTAILESGGTVNQETRKRDDMKGESLLMRSKEDALDYRYFPEPDLPAFTASATTTHQETASNQESSLNSEIQTSFDYIRTCKQEFGFSKEYINTLLNDKALFDSFFQLVDEGFAPKNIAKRIAGPLMKSKISTEIFLTNYATLFRDFLTKEKEGWLTDNQLKLLFDELLATGDPLEEIIKRKGFDTPAMDTETLEKIIEEVLTQNPIQVQQFKDGKEALMGFFIGQIMRKTWGSSDPQTIKNLILNKMRL